LKIPISVVNSKYLGRMPMFLHFNYLSEAIGIERARSVAGGLLAISDCWQFHGNERIAEPGKARPSSFCSETEKTL
jgi:hypothetical protein